MSKIIISLIIIAIVVLGALLFMNKNPYQDPQIEETTQNPEQNNIEENVTEKIIKEFTMDSFVEFIDEKPKPQFSIKEMAVNKGDMVRIKVTNKSGKHDFKLDEFNIYEDTPIDQEIVIEFTADKAGEFIYYCNQPGHRTAGHWGTLKVTK